MVYKTKSVFTRGDIVLVPFPFTDLSGNKIRPALVLGLNDEDVVVSFISSKNNKTKKFEIVVEPDKTNNLKIKSKVICSKIATLDKKIIFGVIGSFSEEYLKQVRVCLKEFLGV